MNIAAGPMAKTKAHEDSRELSDLEKKLLHALQRYTRETDPETILCRLTMRITEVFDQKAKEKL
jgi:hypothetical protein